MDKYVVEQNMPKAQAAIKKVFGENPAIDNTYRSAMSGFGSAVLMSGLLPAIAYYQKNNPKVVDLLVAMYDDVKDGEGLFNKFKGDKPGKNKSKADRYEEE